MPAARSVLFRAVASTDKRDFAKTVRRFVKRARRLADLPGLAMLWIACAAAAALMTVTGGFGTGAMPLGQRALFWALLMGWSGFKWQLWFWKLVHRPEDWLRAAAIGGVILTLPIPLEIWISARAVGQGAEMPDALGTWGRALAIGGVVLVTILLVTRALGHRLRWSAPASGAGGLLERARIDPAALTAIEAEDHYCRVHHRSGPSALVHYRFGDALAEVTDIEGTRVHRGAWVAADAVEGATREGRRWELILAGGPRVPVSATYLPQARARGWLTTRGNTCAPPAP